jgi:ribosomal protein S18 acetylase RimI-like enzyme
MTTQLLQSTSISNQESSVALLVKAFSEDPAVRWMYPDADPYLEDFPGFVRAFGGRAFDCGTADYLPDFQGAALWLPPRVQPDEELLVGLLQLTVPESKQGEVFSIFEQMGKFHPAEPHWHLTLIGVDPLQQGQGFGSTLLNQGLDRCDGDHSPAYLESTNPRNVPFYERHGFKVIGRIQVGHSPEIIPMWRAPQSTSASDE